MHQKTQIFLYRFTKYRFTRFAQNTRFTRKNEAISLASEITHRRSLGHEKKRKGMNDPDILARKGTGTRDEKSSSGDLVHSGRFWMKRKDVLFS